MTSRYNAVQQEHLSFTHYHYREPGDAYPEGTTPVLCSWCDCNAFNFRGKVYCPVHSLGFTTIVFGWAWELSTTKYTWDGAPYHTDLMGAICWERK